MAQVQDLEPILVLYQAIGKLCLISLAGYLAVRFKVLTCQAISSLSKFVIAVSLPCLIIATLDKNLHADMLGDIGFCLVLAAGLNSLALVVALTAKQFIPRSASPEGNLFISLAAMQNSGYLPIPLMTALLTGREQARGLLFTFIFMFVMGLFFWSAGVMLINGTRSDRIRPDWQNIINPPIIALFCGLIFLLPQFKAGYDKLHMVKGAVQTVGDATIPLVLIVLGGSFAAGSRSGCEGKWPIFLAGVVKLLAIPALVLLIVMHLRLDPVLSFTLILQAAMPAAMNHIVVAQEYGGNVSLTSRALLFQYLVAIFTIPFFVFLFTRLSGS